MRILVSPNRDYMKRLKKAHVYRAVIRQNAAHLASRTCPNAIRERGTK